MQAAGFKCCLFGSVKQLDTNGIRAKSRQTMSDVAKYATVATLEALQDASLAPEEIQTEKTGIVVGTGGGGINEVTRVEHLLEAHQSISRAGATGVVKIMNSTASANLAVYLGVPGRVYSISSACNSGLDNIGYAYELIRHGLLDICICGSAEEDTWKQVGVSFDNGGAMPTTWNDRPAEACRPYDRDRQGLVMAAGAGIVILETLQHAQNRGARIYAEVAGYGSANDGEDMWQPSGKGLKHAMQEALNSAAQHGITKIDYLNPHGAGTQIGDIVEVQVIKEALGKTPLVSSTKALTGHALAAAGSTEAIYSLLMLHYNFVAATANLQNIASECEGIRHVQILHQGLLETALTFNAGLGGTNSCLIFKKW
jgi:3-oxoacyl-[acyl-carrier-protein] synthase-1